MIFVCECEPNENDKWELGFCDSDKIQRRIICMAESFRTLKLTLSSTNIQILPVSEQLRIGIAISQLPSDTKPPPCECR